MVAALGLFQCRAAEQLNYFTLWKWSCNNQLTGTSLVVQWLGLCASTTRGKGLIPGQGTKIPQATRSGQKKKKKNQLTDKSVLPGKKALISKRLQSIRLYLHYLLLVYLNEV